jgi:hypothetical protein
MAKKSTFTQNLHEIERELDSLIKLEASRVVEWTLNSVSWKILKEIRRPESQGGWPIDTKTSWKKWGFKRVKKTNGYVSFIIYNNAMLRDKPPPAKYSSNVEYVPFVYAKGDSSKSPIAHGIVKRAIVSVHPTVKKNYLDRMNSILAKRRRHGR